MAETQYSYAISGLKNGTIDPTVLHSDCTGCVGFLYIIWDDVTVTIVSDPALSSSDKNTLDGDSAQAPNDPPPLGSLMGDHDGI